MPDRDNADRRHKIARAKYRMTSRPDYAAALVRRGSRTVRMKGMERDDPLPLLFNSTGVKIYSEGEWLDQNHGVRCHRRWRDRPESARHVADRGLTAEIRRRSGGSLRITAPLMAARACMPPCVVEASGLASIVSPG